MLIINNKLLLTFIKLVYFIKNFFYIKYIRMAQIPYPPRIPFLLFMIIEACFPTILHLQLQVIKKLFNYLIHLN